MRRCRGMRAAVTNGPKPHCPALASKYPELREYPKYPKYHTGWSVRHSTRECCQAFRAESSPTKRRSRSSALGRGSSDPTGRAAARTVPRGPSASASAARTTHAMLVFRLSSLHPPVRDAADVEWRWVLSCACFRLALCCCSHNQSYANMAGCCVHVDAVSSVPLHRRPHAHSRAQPCKLNARVAAALAVRCGGVSPHTVRSLGHTESQSAGW